MKPNTNYGLRDVADPEIVAAFGSLAACLRVTGGDLPTILFYLANPGRIRTVDEAGRPVDSLPPQLGDFAESFRERALAESAGAAYDGMEKPTIAAVSREIGVCRSVARRALVTAGRLAA